MVEIPAVLRGVFFTHRWENSRIWALPTPSKMISMKDLVWHLDLPVWTTMLGEPRFDLAPAAVLRAPEAYPQHWGRIHSVELSYPLEMFKNGERWVVVDGYHRLARYSLEKAVEVPVRKHGDECWEAVSI